VYYLLAVGLLRLSKIQQKKNRIFKLIYRYHDIYIYSILNSVPPKKEHRILKKGMWMVDIYPLIKWFIVNSFKWPENLTWAK
jgi:hypothetical protein